MKRVIGGLVAVMTTAALWGCDAVRNILQAALPQTAQATAAPQTVTATALPMPEVTPVDSGVAYSPEPWQPPGGTVVICPDQCPDATPQPTPPSSPIPTPTPTPRPLWGKYWRGDSWAYNHDFPAELKQLQAWRENGVKLFYANTEAEKVVTGMALDESTGEIAYELTRLDPDEYGFVGGNFYPLKQNVAIDGRPAWGFPDWGFAGTFVERDGKMVFHKPGVDTEHNGTRMNIIAGYINLPSYLNGDKTKLWDFTKVKLLRKLIPPPGVFEGVDIELSPDIPLVMDSDFVAARYPVELGDATNPTGDLRKEFSQRIAYDEKSGILVIGGWTENDRPVCWWGTVKQTQTGKKLLVGTQEKMWYLYQLGGARIISWVIKDGMVCAMRGAGAKSCDKYIYGRASRNSDYDCWIDTFKFPLDYVIDPPPKPDWFTK